MRFSGTEYKDRWSFKSHIVYLSVKDKDFLDEFVKTLLWFMELNRIFIIETEK